MCNWVRVRGDPQTCRHHNFCSKYLQDLGVSALSSPICILLNPLIVNSLSSMDGVPDFLTILPNLGGLLDKRYVLIVLIV